MGWLNQLLGGTNEIATDQVEAEFRIWNHGQPEPTSLNLETQATIHAVMKTLGTVIR